MTRPSCEKRATPKAITSRSSFQHRRLAKELPTIRLATTDTSSQKLLVIAEKPSVMNDIAKALCDFTKHDDHYESEMLVVAAASGHLLEQQMPDEPWGFAAMPILPALIAPVPKASQQKRLTHLVALLSRPDIVGVINACDAGREGELIFREIIEHAECSKPLSRLWLQSMTGDGIRRAFQNIRTNASVEGLAAAGKCRTIADWLIGINVTRALTALISAGGGFHKTPAGRVQTPTLAMIVERERSVLAFIPQPYWEAVTTIDLGKGKVVETKWRAGGTAAAGDEGTRIGSAARATEISEGFGMPRKQVPPPIPAHLFRPPRGSLVSRRSWLLYCGIVGADDRSDGSITGKVVEQLWKGARGNVVHNTDERVSR